MIYLSTSSLGIKSSDEMTSNITDFLHSRRVGIEFSSGFKFSEDFLADLPVRFKIHNYSPAPNVPFVLNLASRDEVELTKSKQFVERNLDLTKRFGAGSYAFHAGYCQRLRASDFGKKLSDDCSFLTRLDCERFFYESLPTVPDGSICLIENNVLSWDNRADGLAKLLLVDEDDILRMIEHLNARNYGLLLDLGHWKVSMNSVGKDPISSFSKIGSYINALQLSDNDGFSDQNLSFDEDAWFFAARVKPFYLAKTCRSRLKHMP